VWLRPRSPQSHEAKICQNTATTWWWWWWRWSGGLRNYQQRDTSTKEETLWVGDEETHNRRREDLAPNSRPHPWIIYTHSIESMDRKGEEKTHRKMWGIRAPKATFADGFSTSFSIQNTPTQVVRARFWPRYSGSPFLPSIVRKKSIIRSRVTVLSSKNWQRFSPMRFFLLWSSGNTQYGIVISNTTDLL
jgi:hypothetical protein